MTKTKFLSFAVMILCASTSIASDYPESKLEHEMREMGSLFPLEKYTNFNSHKQIRQNQKKINPSLNEYLYRSSLDILKFAPIISADTVAGVIITDWYEANNNCNVQFKVMVYVPNKDLSSNHFEVIAFERKKINNAWAIATKSTAIAKVLENKIAKKAKDLYLQSSKSN